MEIQLILSMLKKQGKILFYIRLLIWKEIDPKWTDTIKRTASNDTLLLSITKLYNNILLQT
jgi:hypothetical protein